MTPAACTVSHIASLCHGKVVGTARPDPEIIDLLIDSRRLIHTDHTLFVALVTGVNNGHLYIPDLNRKGMRSFLVSELPDPLPEDAHFILVPDTLTALQQLGASRRALFNIPVVGITGSNGKTIVKEWLFQMLCHDYRIVRSPKSYNSQVGVPLSVWKLAPEYNFAIFEAGISRPGEMERLEAVIRPTIGIFTNIGQAHDEHFTGQTEKIREKLKLFTRAEKLIFCADHEGIALEFRRVFGNSGPKPFTWSRIGDANLQVTRIIRQEKTTLTEALFHGKPFSFSIPFTDEASLENALHCVSLLLIMGISPREIHSRSSGLTPIAMRLELKEAINHCSLINDSYNSDFNALSIALDFLQQQNHNRKKTVILSDILQTGRDKQELFRDIAHLLRSRSIDRIIGIGRDMIKYGHVFPMEHAFYQTTEDFLARFPFSSFQHETILLKGARIFEFEKIGQLLQQKAHETVMEINLDALTHNLNYFRGKLRSGTRVMAMVKAFSYGSGSHEIASVLRFHRVDYLAVAYADEGVELRHAGITLPIMVMSPEARSLDTLLKYNLEPEIYNLHILGLLEETMVRNVTSIQQEVRIHLKLDTGMHRLGFDEHEIPPLIERLKQNPGLRVQSVFSHLASSEDPGDDDFTLLQITRFESMSHLISGSLGYPVLRHLLNSAGISRFPAAQYDMVRLGIGLYGVGHNQEEQRQLRNVSTLQSVITQIRHIPAGETVGYNRQGTTSRDTTIAVIPIGYADGLDRRLGNGRGAVRIGDHQAPIIGNICMDLTMIDITDIPGPIREGTPVVIFDDRNPVSTLAGTIGTIPYEVLTGISARVKRIYYYE